VRRLSGAVRQALHHLRLRLFPVRDPWARLPIEAPLAVYGGARHGFDWVFEGESESTVETFDELVHWLGECAYDTDARLFQEDDFWQHPRTFERLRRGDCEDFALWAWRKLLEMGMDADLVIGRRVPPGSANSRHAWILFRDGDAEFLFEPACRDRALAVRPLASVREDYIPELGVSAKRQRFFFAGYAYFLQNPHLGRARDDSSGPPPRHAGRPAAGGAPPRPVRGTPHAAGKQ
jgi:hypothetical protein